MKIKIGNREFELTPEQIEKAKENNETISIDGDFVVRDSSEDETFKKNSYEDGRKAGVEIAVKEQRNALGLDFQGKTLDNLLEAVKVKTLADAKIEPEQKLKDAQKDIEILKGTINSITKEKEDISTQFMAYKSEGKINNTIVSALPDNIILPKEDMITLIKSKLSLGIGENETVVVKDANGEVMKNKTTLDPLPANEAIKSFFAENPSYLKGTEGGAGGADSRGSGGKITVEQFIENKAKEGVRHTDPAFIKELEQMQKDGLIEQ